MAEILQFHPRPSPLAGYFRIRRSNHKQVEALLAAGRFPYRGVVFEASHLARLVGKVELLQPLKAKGCEIFDADQLSSIFAAKGGRSRFACNNAACCPGGIDHMFDNSHVHFIFQRTAQLENLSAIAQARCSEHFLVRYIDPSVRSARRGARLKISDKDVVTAIDQARGRLARLRDALAELDAEGDPRTRSGTVRFRGGGGAISAVVGR
jgi:hypothetical protein